MTRSAVQAWFLVHKWTSLICTVFLLLLCLTGLPLIFAEEIGHLTGAEPEASAPTVGTPASIDSLIEKAKAAYPGNQPLFAGWQEGGSIVYVNLGPTADTPPAGMKTAMFDAYSGAPVEAPQFNEGVMYLILRLHTDMLLNLPGKLFLGGMGVLLAASIVSGVVLYRPFMRKLPFGTVREARSRRLKWLDLHNLLGIVTTAWLLVVGVTGVINTLDELLYDDWQRRELAELTGKWQGKPRPSTFGSMDQAIAAARAARPDLKPAFVSYPGTGYSGDHHYGVFMNGDSPLAQRNYQPVLVDAATSKLTGVPQWPLTLTALYVTQPLHYGNYGGLGLKIVWAVLDLLAIVVLASGIYLWLRRGPAIQTRALREEAVA